MTFAPQPLLSASPQVQRTFIAATWVLAALTVIHRVFFVAFNGTITDDFTTVYSALERMSQGQGLYDQHYDHVDPLYLYNPGASILLSPLILLPLPYVRALFIVANALSIIIAIFVLTRMAAPKDNALRAWCVPVAITAAFLTESVTNTLAFTNINGILLLCLSVFLYLSAQAYEHRAHAPHRMQWIAGLVIGCAIVVKPQFAPLLALPLVMRDWRAVLGGLSIPIISNGVAFATVDSASDYLHKLVPYLSQPRDYANSSWPGLNTYAQLSPVLYWTVWLLFATVIGLSLLMALRLRNIAPTLWLLLSSGLIFLGIFILSSLGQQYYSMWLFPLVFTVFWRSSPLRCWHGWLGIFLIFLPYSWASSEFPTFGRVFSTYAPLIGWMIVAACSCAALAASVLARGRESKLAPHGA